MENLNAKQIKSELEGLVNYLTCPEYIKNALALINSQEQKIKELTEENEKLTQKLKIEELKVESKERICESYMLQYGTVADKEVFLKKERADTVRKMHSEIEERCIKGGIYPAFVASTIDQIAKEMSENE